MEDVKSAQETKSFCHDCQKEIEMKDGQLVDGVCLVYKDSSREYEILKCNSCYEKNKSLTNFQPCEVYSRIVGYIRPLQQWNAGKAKEYSERKEFNVQKIKMKMDCC